MEFQTPILSIEDIAALEEKYNQELLSGRGVDKQTKFNYAFALVQSEYRQDLQRGIALLEDLLKAEPGNRDYTYYHALGLYRSQQYADARVAIAALLRAEPGNRQALMLRDEIDAAVLRDGLAGAGMVAGALGVGAIILGAAALMMRSRR